MKDTALINGKANKIIKAILFCVVFTGLFIAFSFLKSFIPETFERIAHGVIGTFVALLCTYLFLRYDKKTFSEIGLLFESTTVTPAQLEPPKLTVAPVRKSVPLIVTGVDPELKPEDGVTLVTVGAG